MDAAASVISLVIFILPSYFANSIPVVLGGGMPIDLKMKFSDGRRLFGDGKTIRGFLTGIFAGIVIASLEGIFLPGTRYDIYDGSPATYVLAGSLLSLGTMVGDLAGSFVKRRQNIAPGKPSLLMDQLSFLAFALLFAYPFAGHLLTPMAVLFLGVLTYFVHVGANIIANRLGLKKVPW